MWIWYATLKPNLFVSKLEAQSVRLVDLSSLSLITGV